MKMLINLYISLIVNLFMINCQPIYYANIPTCIEKIIIDAELEDSKEYEVVVIDKFNNHYINKFTTNIDSKLEIDIEKYPHQLFNSYAGSFLLIIKDDCVQVNPIICDTQYNSISLIFYSNVSDLDSNEFKIGCCNE